MKTLFVLFDFDELNSSASLNCLQINGSYQVKKTVLTSLF